MYFLEISACGGLAITEVVGSRHIYLALVVKLYTRHHIIKLKNDAKIGRKTSTHHGRLMIFPGLRSTSKQDDLGGQNALGAFEFILGAQKTLGNYASLTDD